MITEHDFEWGGPFFGETPSEHVAVAFFLLAIVAIPVSIVWRWLLDRRQRRACSECHKPRLIKELLRRTDGQGEVCQFCVRARLWPKLAVMMWLICLGADGQVMWKATWDTNPEPNCAGYRVLMGSTPGRYTATNSTSGRVNNSVVLSNAPTVGVVYLVAVAYDDQGREGYYSPEISFTNYLSAPKNFRLQATIQASVSTNGPWRDLARVTVPVGAAPQSYRSLIRVEETP